MPRAANDVMQSILFSAMLDGIAALKRASGGLPNQLLRDVQAIHPNVTFADLPKELQDQIAESTRAAFTQLLKEGYAVASRCSSRGRWTESPSATAADRLVGRRKVNAAAGDLRRATALTGPAAEAVPRARASRPRASRGWVELAGVRG